ncbi:unnamed protein product [Hermetia illucens]|uniref:receptor protein serine/threonine kinase n=1 Tax=Hermetia illucens TaxID=343691 RepID=A0A7R8UFQ3_HERIL|nr:bone morphogenetic protein receptor type-1B isoform X2 [Hermetia illucens]CAD7079997.1 unnamed protein product [Hermetia illucens]
MAPRSRKKKAHDRVLTCYCDGHCPGNSPNSTCQTRPGGSCFSAVEAEYEEETGMYVEYRTFGCMAPEENGGLLMCKVAKVPHLHGKNILCCDGEDLCNRDLNPKFTPKTPVPPVKPAEEALSSNYFVIFSSIIVGLSVFAVLIVVAFLTYRRREKQRKQPRLMDGMCGSQLAPLQDLVEQSSGSGSAALPLLVQRTIAKQVQIIQPIGRGQYGEVWLAKWRDEKVAVKIFFTSQEASWFRETEIYQTVLMRHDNILGFIAADIKGTGSYTQMLLITDYHERGSLYDYLQKNVLSPQKLQVLAYSLAAGLTHLHTEICCRRTKPAIAHRDLKSKNILVKRNGQCAIADFGLAVKYSSEHNEIHIAQNETRVGTRRYMAPEVLDHSLNPQQFEAFKMADMYSMALVLWEMCRRCCTPIKGTISTTCEDYALPYHDYVPFDPSFEEMHAVVCVKEIRPPVPSRWQDDEVLATLAKIMQECWHPNPTVRLTSLRVKKTLKKLEGICINIV